MQDNEKMPQGMEGFYDRSPFFGLSSSHLISSALNTNYCERRQRSACSKSTTILKGSVRVERPGGTLPPIDPENPQSPHT